MEEPKKSIYDSGEQPEEVFLRVSGYLDRDRLYVGIYQIEYGYPELFSDLTVNLHHAPLNGVNEAYIDHNFSKEHLRFIRKMNKEIRDYQESMFWGLSFRQCLFSVLAILAALGIYFLTRKYAGEQVTGWLCVLGAAPFAACGFFRYHGMTAEQFAWTVIKSELLYPKRLVFKSENLYFSCMEESLRLGEKMMGNGAELLEKKRTKQKKPKKPRGRGDAFD